MAVGKREGTCDRDLKRSVGRGFDDVAQCSTGHCSAPSRAPFKPPTETVMSKSFKQSIRNSKRGYWILHPVDAVPVWVPAKRK